MKTILLTLFIACLAVATKAQTAVTDTIQWPIDSITWKPAPAPFPPGALMVVLEGNPKQEGFFTIRVKFPPNYILPAHFHPKDERVTLLSGSVYVGFGEKADLTKGKKYTAGSFYINPAGSHHYVYTKEESVIMQLNGIGPWGLTYCGGGK